MVVAMAGFYAEMAQLYWLHAAQTDDEYLRTRRATIASQYQEMAAVSAELAYRDQWWRHGRENLASMLAQLGASLGRLPPDQWPARGRAAQ
jgi:hypothetical protein